MKRRVVMMGNETPHIELDWESGGAWIYFKALVTSPRKCFMFFITNLESSAHLGGSLGSMLMP